jgi:hypothetical protein
MKAKTISPLSSFLTLFMLLFCGLIHAQGTLPDTTTAGWAKADPGYTYGSQGKDITNNVKYFYVQNKQIIANISTVDVSNNTVGGMHKGVPMDVIRKGKNRDNIDWTQLVIHKSLLADWDYASKNVNMDSIWVAGNDSSVYAFGASSELPKIKVRANYSVLPNAPVLKIKLKLFNRDTTAFNGFIEYQMDPDEVNNQRGWIPGLGDAPGLVSSGWSSNYVYGGSQGKVYSGYPNHGISWVKNSPAALLGSTIVFGAWFDVNIKRGDSAEIEFYHITEIADSTKHKIAQESIAEWAGKILKMDPDLSNYNIIRGKVEDVHGDVVKNVVVKAKNTKAVTIAQSVTDTLGNYTFLIPRDVYTFTVTGLGYLSQSRSISMSSAADTILDFTLAENFALTPIQVWAGTGKQLIVPGLVSCGEDDIIMENDKIAIAIGVKNEDPQLSYGSKGSPLDIIVKGSENDLIDWLSLMKISYTSDTLEQWWSRQLVKMDSVYVTSNTSSEAKVRADGRLFRKYKAPLLSYEKLEIKGKDSSAYRTDIAVSTEYTLNYGDNFVFAKSTIINNSTTDTLKAFIGDILDFDGTGETSYLPGIGEITGDFGRSRDYEFRPNAPWFAQYGAASLAYGIVYEGAMADSMMAYGVKRWMSNKKQIALLPQTSYSMDRYIVAASTIGLSSKSDAIADIYSKIKVKQSGISFDVTHTNNIIAANDTMTVTVKVKNMNTTPVSGVRAHIVPGYNAETIGNDSQILSLNSHDSTTLTFRIVARTGGRAFTALALTDHLNNAFERKISVFVKGKGWYAGDNHTHSKYSDGVGTIAENVESGYAKGLAFMTATDHNTLNQKADVDFQDAKYEDMIIMTGEEVTTSKGHCLAYNTGAIIPWNLNVVTQQQIIDSTNKAKTQYGNGFMYLAHPHYPGLPWLDYSVRRHAGLEVWNGFYYATHSVNSLTFKDWDSLNVLGLHLLGISNSDAHNPAVVGKNYIMAYLEDFTKEEIISSMRDKGTYFGTNGPLLNLMLEGTMMGGNIKSSPSGRTISIDVEGNSNSTNPVTAMRLLKNGKVIKTWNPNAGKAAYKITDNGKPGDFYRLELESGSTFYAFSNPVWVIKGAANANLASLSVDSSLITGFDSLKLNYTAKSSKVLHSVQAVPADTNATVSIQKPVNLASFNVADRTARITVLADDKTASKTYTIVFDRLRKTNANLESLAVNQTSVAGFDSLRLNYTQTVSNNAVTIKGIPADSNATVSITNPANLFSSVTADRTAKITVFADDKITSKVYTIVFDRLKRANANLKSLAVNQVLVTGFDSLKLSYTYAPTSTSFSIQGIPADSNASVTIQKPLNLFSNSAIERTASIKVLADDGVTTKTYTILFDRLKRADANLKSLAVNQAAISGFDSLKTSYSYVVNKTSVTIQAVPADSNAIVSILGPVNLWSAIATDRTATITVLADNKVTTKTYTIVFDKLKMANANLLSLSLNQTLLPGFDSLKTAYSRVVSDSSFTIQAIPADPNATVSIRRPVNIYSGNQANRTAVIVVTAENQVSTKNYEILFDLSTGILMRETDASGISIYPVPANDIVYIQVKDAASVQGYKVYNMQGIVVTEGNISEETTAVSLADCKKGPHYIEFITKDRGRIYKQIIIIK